MKPYYDDGIARIYHADCREWMSSVPSCFCVDALVTDSPYGIDLGKSGADHRLATEAYAHYDDSADNYRDICVPAITSGLAISSRGAVFAPFRQLTLLPQPAAVAAIYNPAGAGRSSWGFTCLHLVFLYGTNPNIGNGCVPTVKQSHAVTEKNGHPCPKPIEWMRWIVDMATLQGETVLDIFAGSGTTLVAAKQLGRKAIGIEISEQYCEIAAKRLAQGVLFGIADVEPMQESLL